jgi:flagellar basal-body rod protein FlgF
MDRMLYVAMSGAKQTMLAQSVNAHNLANTSTTGFRADLARMQSMPVYGPGYGTRVYGQSESNGTDMSSGGVISTGRELDIAIKGEGLIAIQAPDGGESYTRAGDLQLTATGQLLTGAGYPVIGNGGPIAIPPAEKIEIADDGTISIHPIGQETASLAVIDRIKLVKPEKTQLVKGDQGLLQTKDGTPAPADAGVKVASGTLETSNVNAIEAMVSMIELARKYEMQVKMMRTASENASATAKLMQLN